MEDRCSFVVAKKKKKKNEKRERWLVCVVGYKVLPFSNSSSEGEKEGSLTKP